MAATGAVGSVILLQKPRIPPDNAFSANDRTVHVIFIVGIGRLAGAVIGTVLFFILREFLADWGAVHPIVPGVIAIATMVFSRQGLRGLV